MKIAPLWNRKYMKNYPYQDVSSCDVLIIGGGITGFNTAYFLKDKALKTILIEKGKIGEGVSYRSTAKATYLQKDIYQKLEKYFNYDTSKLYFKSQKEAIFLLKRVISDNHIVCNFKRDDGYLFTTEDKNVLNLEKEMKLLSSFGVACHESDTLPISFPIKKSFFVTDTYSFDPMMYIDSLANIVSKSIPILEDTIAFQIDYNDDKYIVHTNHGNITCKYVVVANHYPFFLYPSFIPLKNYMAREYVNASPISKKYSFQAINIDSTLHSMRFYNNYLIYGSNQHRLTNKLDYQKNYRQSQNDFQKYFELNPEYTWMNQDLMTNDFLPLIGRLQGKCSNIFIATGYNGWGITNSMIAAKMITDSIFGKDSPYQQLFNPSRIHMIGVINSFVDSLFYLKAYVQAPFLNYSSNNNVKKICPHMKCKLLFNKEELTWDCPCHGSRFDIDGNILEGPAKESIKLNK